MFKKFKLIYRIIAFLAIVIYFTYYGQETLIGINYALREAMIASGEISEEESLFKITTLDKGLENYLKKGSFYKKAEAGKKLVIYTNVDTENSPAYIQFKKDMEGYKNSPDWREKFTFAENNNKEFHSGAFYKYCQMMCIVDFENQKMLSFDINKTGDSDYLYKFLAAGYSEN